MGVNYRFFVFGLKLARASAEHYRMVTILIVQGAVLSGTDGNIYIASDPASGLGVSVNKISQDAFTQKAQEQQQAAQQFAEQYPEAAGYSGTGVSGVYYPPTSATNDVQYSDSGDTELANAQQALAAEQSADAGGNSGNDTGETSSSSSVKWTPFKLACLGEVAVGAGLIGASGVIGIATAGFGAPVSGTLLVAGVSMVAGSIAGMYVDETVQDNIQKVNEMHSSNPEFDKHKKDYEEAQSQSQR